MTTLSTHVLDAALGSPASGLDLHLAGPDGSVLETTTTDSDGRVRFDTSVVAGEHRIVFATGPWFAAADRATFFPTVTVAFTVEGTVESTVEGTVGAGQNHHHVALLLSPFSYTTYRGS